MADTVSANGDALKTSGSRRKNKKGAAAAAPKAVDGVVAVADLPVSAAAAAAVEDDDKSTDPAHIRVLIKNIRNVNKKLAGTAKVDAIVAEHPTLSLDDLINERKINADQKAQALKKPALQAQLVQFEEQLALLRKLEDGFNDRMRAELQRVEAAHQKEMDDLRVELAAEAASQTAAAAGGNFGDKMLVLSKFLRAAAARRATDDETSDESRAFEGLLLLVYGGDAAASDAAEKLIQGVHEPIPSVEGDALSITYNQVQSLSLAYSPDYAPDAPATNGVVDEHNSDPTVAHAGLTELRDNSHVTEMPVIEADTFVPAAEPSPLAPTQGNLGDGAANVVAEQQWDAAAGAAPTDQMDSSWVSVPRPIEETEQAGVVAAGNSGQNWADEQPADTSSTAVGSQSGATSDGFREVTHGRGRGRGGGGEMRGRGGRGGAGWHRGEGRGRGPRGDRGGPRGGRGGRGGGFRGGRGDAAPTA